MTHLRVLTQLGAPHERCILIIPGLFAVYCPRTPNSEPHKKGIHHRGSCSGKFRGEATIHLKVRPIKREDLGYSGFAPGCGEQRVEQALAT
jgi:hypothetical protein